MFFPESAVNHSPATHVFIASVPALSILSSISLAFEKPAALVIRIILSSIAIKS